MDGLLGAMPYHLLLRDRAIEIVGMETNVPRQFLMETTSRGIQQISMARQLLMWLLWQTGKFSYPQIGRMLQRDHTTVMYGVRAMHRRRCRDLDWMGITERALQAMLDDPQAIAATP